MEITLKNKCCLYVIISIRFFPITICNLLNDFISYHSVCSLVLGLIYFLQEIDYLEDQVMVHTCFIVTLLIRLFEKKILHL